MNSIEHRDNVLGIIKTLVLDLPMAKLPARQNTVVVAFYGLPSGGQPAATDAQNSSPTATNTATTAQHVNGATSIVNGSAPWATYASIALSGAQAFLASWLRT